MVITGTLYMVITGTLTMRVDKRQGFIIDLLEYQAA